MNDLSIIQVAGHQALAELDRLRREFKSTGLYPILFGDETDLARVRELRDHRIESGILFEEIVRESEDIDAAEWFENRLADYVDLEDREDDEWPDEPTEELGIITHNDIQTGDPKPNIVIGLLKVTHPWQVFADLKWGGWNECPSPAEHCAIHRYWQQKHGADVVSITGDIVQSMLSNPPKSRADGIQLAREQYAYCCDIVEQGTGTITNLAAGLVDSPYWYFWWD